LVHPGVGLEPDNSLGHCDVSACSGLNNAAGWRERIPLLAILSTMTETNGAANAACYGRLRELSDPVALRMPHTTSSLSQERLVATHTGAIQETQVVEDFQHFSYAISNRIYIIIHKDRANREITP